VSELLTLPRSALGGRAEVMIFRGKGGKERMVPLSAAARNAAAELLSTPDAPGRPATGRWLCPGRDPKVPLTRQAFFLLLKQLALEAGLDPARVSPHVLRH